MSDRPPTARPPATALDLYRRLEEVAGTVDALTQKLGNRLDELDQAVEVLGADLAEIIAQSASAQLEGVAHLRGDRELVLTKRDTEVLGATRASVVAGVVENLGLLGRQVRITIEDLGPAPGIVG